MRITCFCGAVFSGTPSGAVACPACGAIVVEAKVSAADIALMEADLAALIDSHEPPPARTRE